MISMDVTHPYDQQHDGWSWMPVIETVADTQDALA
jgi:hypothetical protein